LIGLSEVIWTGVDWIVLHLVVWIGVDWIAVHWVVLHWVVWIGVHWIGVHWIHWVVHWVEHRIAVWSLVWHVSVLVELIVVVWTELISMILISILSKVLPLMRVISTIVVLIEPHRIIITTSHCVHTSLMHGIVSSHIAIEFRLVVLIWSTVFLAELHLLLIRLRTIRSFRFIRHLIDGWWN
jgi:hypothetical protein